VSHPVSLGRRLAVAALAALALLAVLLPATAPAARVPRYQAGREVTFRITTQEPNARQYGVYITISARRRTDRYGALKRTRVGTFARMVRKRGNRWAYTTPDYTFPGWFMVETGTYWWQTSITDCSVPGCKILSRIRAFKVV
jgi:hypothetical protein